MASEQSKRFGLPSGAALVVTVAPFQDAWALTKAALKSLKGGASLAQADLTKDFTSFSAATLALPGLFDRLVSFATSEEVEAAVFKCAQRALYIPNGSVPSFPGMKVDKNLFDDPGHAEGARSDYALIIARIMEVNCKPFLAQALSALLGPKQAAVPPAENQSSDQK